MPYRLIYLGLALVAVAAVALAVAFSGGGVGSEALPEPVESVSPQPGDLVPPQAFVEIDMKVGYRADLYVDGWLVQDTTFIEGTGVYRWAPSPANPTITEWTPGEHTIRVVWDSLDGLADPGRYEWSFRVG